MSENDESNTNDFPVFFSENEKKAEEDNRKEIKIMKASNYKINRSKQKKTC